MTAPALAVVLAILAGQPQQASGVSGTVVTANDAVVAAAVVNVDQGGRRAQAVTNERGEFRLENVSLPATLEVTAGGFASVRLSVTSSPVRVQLAAAGIRESILVSGASPQDSLRRPATGTTVLGAATLGAVPAVTLDETLRVIPGLSLFRRSSSRASNPTTHGVTMRGLSASGASRGLILLDGIPLHEGFGSWVTWTRLPALALESVEIDRGAQGATFGSDALGGAINLRSRQAARRSAEAGVIVGGPELWEVDGAASAIEGRASGVAAISFLDTGGVIPVAPESRGTVDVKAGARWSNGLFKTAWTEAGQRFSAQLLIGRDERGNGTPAQNNDMEGGTFAVGYDGDARGTRVAVQAAAVRNQFNQSFSTVAAGRNSETTTFTQSMHTDATRGTVEAGRAIPKGYVSARAAYIRGAARFGELRFAGAGRGSIISTTRDLRDDSDAYSAHLGFAPVATVTLGGGIRHERRRAPERLSTWDSATVAHLSGAWSASQRVAIRGAVASSHRWPTLNELVRNFQVGAVLTQANPDLLPERARSAEGGVTVTGGRWLASATGFWSVVDDAIANFTIQTTPSIIRQRRNAGEARAAGAEMDFELRPHERARIRASAVVVNARFRNSIEPALEGNRLPQVPRASFSLTGDVRLLKGVDASVLWRSLASQFDDDRNVFELADAHQLDVRVLARWRTLTWTFTVDNALDERIEVGRTPLVTLAPGRTARVGVGWKFN
jgi:outer membrane receptor protein involved in Fe transport